MASMASKRKRETNDMPHPRAAPGMPDDFENQYLHTGDDGMDHGEQDMSFVSALTQHNNDMGDNQDHHHDPNQPGAHDVSRGAGGPSVSDTAAAAMAQYHTMTVPQSTEQAFLAQTSDGAGDRHGHGTVDPGNPNLQPRPGSFGDFDVNGPPNGMPTQNDNSASPTLGNAQNAGGPKPQVGTDEWHKIRRDNHKEGTY